MPKKAKSDADPVEKVAAKPKTATKSKVVAEQVIAEVKLKTEEDADDEEEFTEKKEYYVAKLEYYNTKFAEYSAKLQAISDKIEYYSDAVQKF